MKPPYAIGSVPSLSGHAIAYRWRSLPRVCRHRASKPQGSSERVLPWQITMDQLIFASLSHTHYWYEVGMLKVPWQLNGFPLVVTLGEQYNIGEKPIVILHTYINRHAGTPENLHETKTRSTCVLYLLQKQCSTSSNVVSGSSVGTFSGSFHFILLYFCTLVWVSL